MHETGSVMTMPNDTVKGKNLIEKLIRLREEKKMSYADIAQKGMVRAQLVEDIEKGVVSPSTGVLKRIAQALDVPLADLFQEVEFSDKDMRKIRSSQEILHIKHDKRKSLRVKGSGVVYYYLTPTLGERKLEVLWQEVQPGASGGDWLFHEGEECFLILKGQFRLYIDDEVYDLEEGDTLWFKTHRRHKWENPGDTEAVVLVSITPPWF